MAGVGRKSGRVIGMAWVYLGIAAVFEVIFAMSMKYSDGFTKLLPSTLVVIGGAGGLFFLTLAMKHLPVSVAYPIWTAVGILGTVTLGALMLGESITALKVASAVLIVVGVAGLKISSG